MSERLAPTFAYFFVATGVWLGTREQDYALAAGIAGYILTRLTHK